MYDNKEDDTIVAIAILSVFTKLLFISKTQIPALLIYKVGS